MRSFQPGIGRNRPATPSRIAVRSRTGGILAIAYAATLVAVMLVLIASQARAAERARPESPFVSVGRTVRPAVVNIRITRAVNAAGVDQTPLQEMYRRFFPDKAGEGGRFENPGTGSGFVIDPAGDILTNNHVIAGADRIFVRFSGSRREYQATLVGTDASTDVALLHIDPDGASLPTLKFGDSQTLAVGDWAIAVGNPFGNLEGTMTVGIVSAEGRGDLVIQGLTPRYQDFIQTDASINFGNSGGPLVDIEGHVIGVNTAINAEGQGIGFAVPSRLVKRIYEQLRDHGRVIRGFLGVKTIDAVTALEATGDDDGARVESVVAGSPAAAAGLKPGDVIVQLGDETIESRRQLDFVVAEAPVGQALPCRIVRGGDRQDLSVTLVELDAASMPPPAADETWLGLTVADLAETDHRVDRIKETLGIEATRGVIVVAVESGQPAAQAGLRPGDIVVAVEGQEIADLAAYTRARDALRSQREPLTFLVRTGTRENFVEVTPRESGSVQ